MNKRGFIFTFISVTLVSVLVLAFLIQYTSRAKAEIEKTNTEVETMNSFVKALNDDYLPRALRVSGNQAILALLQNMSENDAYITNGEIRNYIVNAMIDGEYNNNFGQPQGPLLKMMKDYEGANYTINDTLKELVHLANLTGITFRFDEIRDNPSDLNTFQGNPWQINFTLKLTYEITNRKGDVSWSYSNKIIRTSMPITAYRDPFYMIDQDGDGNPGVNITINRTIYDLPGEINPHVQYTNFLACNQAPSFLNRMQKITTASEFGIESMVDFKNPSQTAIDYQYITGIDPAQLTQIGNSGYYIDSSHSECYGIGEGQQEFQP